MSGAHVFISHSAKEPEARAALHELADALDGAGLEVLLDRERLVVGSPWRPTLRKWLDICRAAVVLVSPSAIASPNVLNEVAILMQRQRRAGRFPVLPILVAGAENRQLREPPWKATELAEMQTLTWSDGVVADVCERLAALARAVDAADMWLELSVADRCKELLPAVVREVGACLGMGISEWELEGNGAEALAQRFLESSHPDQLTAALKLRKIDRELARSVYRDVEPYGFVDAEVARSLRARAAAPEHRRGVAVNALKSDTYDLLLRRANFEWKLHQVPRSWSEDAVEHVLADVADTVARELKYVDEELPVDFDVLNADLAEAEVPMFLLLPDPLPSAEVVAAIEARLGNLVLLFRCRSGEDVAGLPVPFVEYLRPELHEGADADFAARRRAAERKLERD